MTTRRGTTRRPGTTRDRHGRGVRGPAVWPPRPDQPPRRTDRDRFDDVLLAVVGELEERWRRHLGLLEYGVEDVPVVPDGWDLDEVPLASLVHGDGGRPSRLVVFRRPIEHRAEDRADLVAIVRTVVVEQVAELLGVAPEVVDPRLADED